jgi:hypothetical protein
MGIDINDVSAHDDRISGIGIATQVFDPVINKQRIVAVGLACLQRIGAIDSIFARSRDRIVRSKTKPGVNSGSTELS